MRIWSIHPKYLDSKGLVALWRETLLAKNVLENKTKGYKNHPQLDRFRHFPEAIDLYLQSIYNEANAREYKFNKDKVNWKVSKIQIPVNSGQLEFEREHLLKKLSVRDKEKFKIIKKVCIFESHPLFEVVNGGIENWEKNERNNQI